MKAGTTKTEKLKNLTVNVTAEKGKIKRQFATEQVTTVTEKLKPAAGNTITINRKVKGRHGELTTLKTILKTAAGNVNIRNRKIIT